VGANTVIEFTPSDWPVWSYTFFPAGVLIHELTHALRMIRGLSQNDMLCDEFQNLDDFFAIMMANIYVSELRKGGRPLLQYRANHRRPFQVLASDLAKSLPFFQRFKSRIREFFKEFPGLATALMTLVDLEFNPLALRLFPN
jgi:hypothetical protein